MTQLLSTPNSIVLFCTSLSSFIIWNSMLFISYSRLGIPRFTRYTHNLSYTSFLNWYQCSLETMKTVNHLWFPILNPNLGLMILYANILVYWCRFYFSINSFDSIEDIWLFFNSVKFSHILKHIHYALYGWWTHNSVFQKTLKIKGYHGNSKHALTLCRNPLSIRQRYGECSFF